MRKLIFSDLGFEVLGGMPHVIDLQVAHDVLVFVGLAMAQKKLLDGLVAELSEVGLVLNGDKNGRLANQS